MRTIASAWGTACASFLVAGTVVRGAVAVEEGSIFEDDMMIDLLAIALILMVGVGLALLVRRMSARG